MRRLAVPFAILALFGCSSTRMPNERPAEAHAAPKLAASSIEDAPVAAIPTPAVAIEEPSHTRYPRGPIHSPMSKAIVGRLSALLAASPQTHDALAKLGDSHTATPFFLSCVAGRDLRLGGHDALASTLSLFHGWERESAAAKVGWHAIDLAGRAISTEVAEARPAFGVVLVGTNDTHVSKVAEFERFLRKSVDQLLAGGTIPIVTTLPPRGDDPKAAALIPEMNAVVRALAQARQVPLLDLQAALAALPDGGLASDGIHLRVHEDGGYHGCWFDERSLEAGMNRRNLATLEAFDRLRRFVIEGETPEIDVAPRLAAGTAEEPIFVDALPFVDDGGVDAGERTYAIELDAPTHLRARVFVDDSADAFIHLDDAPRPARAIDLVLAAGQHRIVIAPKLGKGKAHANAGWRLTIVAEAP